MIRRLISNVPLALALAAALAGAPSAEAQRGNRDRDGDRRWEERRRDDDDRRHRGKHDDRRRVSSNRRVPPGWCIGRGNPHNTRENCGYSARRNDGRVWRDGRWVYVGDRRIASSGRYSTRASWDRAHRDYHEAYERTCRDRVRRVSGIAAKARVTRECSIQHDRWHQLNRRP